MIKRKPNNGQKLCVHKLSFSLVDLDSDDFLNIVQGDAVAIRKWLLRELGWWSATITPTSKKDSKNPLLMNLKPNRKIKPDVLIEDMRRDFDAFKAENADFEADDVHVLVTISNRKPTSTYGDAA